MSFDKDYPNRKDWRKPYRRGKRGYYDATCRPHGGCSWCFNARMHRHRRQMPIIEDHDLLTLHQLYKLQPKLRHPA